jgi:hypothetical protein
MTERKSANFTVGVLRKDGLQIKGYGRGRLDISQGKNILRTIISINQFDYETIAVADSIYS